jgi:hypothetical protein
LHKIRTVSVNTQVDIAPHKNISAKLTQKGSVIIANGKDDAIEYVVNYDKDSGQPVPEGVIVDRRSGQSIYISNTQNENGVHSDNLPNGAYLPFENTGAVSKWSLEYAGNDTFKSVDIKDVILVIEYTALPLKQAKDE